MQDWKTNINKTGCVKIPIRMTNLNPKPLYMNYTHIILEEDNQHLIIVDHEYHGQVITPRFKADVERQIPDIGDYTLILRIDEVTGQVMDEAGSVMNDYDLENIPEDSATYTFGEGIELPDMSGEILENRLNKNKSDTEDNKD